MMVNDTSFRKVYNHYSYTFIYVLPLTNRIFAFVWNLQRRTKPSTYIMQQNLNMLLKPNQTYILSRIKRRFNEGSRLRTIWSKQKNSQICSEQLCLIFSTYHCKIGPKSCYRYRHQGLETTLSQHNESPTYQINGMGMQSEAQCPSLNISDRRANTRSQVGQALSKLKHKEEINWDLQNPWSWIPGFQISFIHCSFQALV